MKKFLLRLGMVVGLSVCICPRLLADVVVTQPTGGNNVPDDLAANSTNGAAFTALGDIVLTEGAAADFALGANQTLVLTLPNDWRFNPGVGSASFTGSRDITAASLAVTASNLTVTFSVGGTSKLDTLTISGVQIQPLDGYLDPNAGYILNLSANPGTAAISGINPDSTTFGDLYTAPGAP